ncbi:MAG: hypothetical protein GX936_01520 [Clostridiales bacterium]|nr:hypothetical protein [Clostridiales bacterium]
MEYIVTAVLLAASIYPFSYVRYVWQKKNYTGAVGMLFMTLLSLSYAVYLLFAR